MAVISSLASRACVPILNKASTTDFGDFLLRLRRGDDEAIRVAVELKLEDDEEI